MRQDEAEAAEAAEAAYEAELAESRSFFDALEKLRAERDLFDEQV